VRNFAIIDPPAAEDQTLTATEKVRRRELERRHVSLINRLYDQEQEWLPAFDELGTSHRKAVPLTAAGVGEST
jgi:hypothetical protein